MNAFDVFLSVASVIVGSGYLILCAYNHENPFFDRVVEEEDIDEKQVALSGEGRRILF